MYTPLTKQKVQNCFDENRVKQTEPATAAAAAVTEKKKISNIHQTNCLT